MKWYDHSIGWLWHDWRARKWLGIALRETRIYANGMWWTAGEDFTKSVEFEHYTHHATMRDQCR